MSKNLVTHPSHEIIERKIYLIRGKKVMLDKELATLYQVSTKALNQAVKRNLERFPEDFMFQLTREEARIWFIGKTSFMSKSLRSQSVTLKRGQHVKHLPYAFTEQGIAMLSSVLKSPRAIHANIQIMRTFTKIKEMLASNEMLRQRIEELEQKFEKHDKQFKVVFDAIREVLETPKMPKKKSIGFHVKY